MLPSRHIIVSLPLALIIWSATQSVFSALLCLIAGVLIDIDHALEYFFHFGLNTFNIKKIYRSCQDFTAYGEAGGVKKIFLMFHAIEIAIFLWLGALLTKNIYLFSIALGYTGHLCLDVSGNVMKPESYFLLWRLKKGFATNKLVKPR